MLHVREGVGELLRAERPFSPVAALLVLGQLHPELVVQKVPQPDALDAQHLGGRMRVEDAPQRQLPFPLEAEHVVLGGVDDHLARGIGEERRQRPQADGEHVDGEVRGGRRDLDQADLLRVGVEPVRFRVQTDARLRLDRRRRAREPLPVRHQDLFAHFRTLLPRLRRRGPQAGACPRSSISLSNGRKRPRTRKSRRSCASPVAAR